MSPTASEVHPTRSRIEAARSELDKQTRECVAWHFDPKTGTPFWLELASGLGWDPRQEIQCYDDLSKLPEFDGEWLRGGPVRKWVPLGLSGRPIYVFETGGSTGVPKSRINVEDFRTDYELFSDTLSDASFPPGADWLMLGPSGPRRLRLAVEHLCQHRGGICFHVDMDPRWVVKLMKSGRMHEMHEYKEHVVSQGLTLLRAHSSIRCLFTTPKLLEAICEHISLVRMGIAGVFCGGTQLTAQFHRFAREELLEGKIDFVPTYGNTLMGLACHKPFDPADNYSVIYYPPSPRAMMEVVDPNQTDREVAYGERGRVRLTTLTKEFFLPRFQERDEGVRRPPCAQYPWDGVGDVKPFAELSTPIVEGVY